MNERYRPHDYPGETPSVHQPTAAREGRQSPEVTAAQLMVRRYLESVNEEMLQSIITEYIGAVGRNTSHLSGFVPMSDIRLIDDKNNPGYGRYMNGESYIELNSFWLADHPVQTLYTLIHEELHACSNNILATIHEETTNYTLYSGVVTSHMTVDNANNRITGSKIDEGTEANEGITELLTRDCLLEYLKRTGDTGMYSADEIEKALYESRHEHGYGAYQKSIDFLALLISAVTQVSIDVVRKGIYRSYFRNSDIFSPEIATIINEYIPGSIQKVHLLLTNKFLAHDFIELQTAIVNSSKLDSSEKENLINSLNGLLAEKFQQKDDLIMRGILSA
ncbi:MAG: hypothetical protein MUF19_02190 [Candidatus Pacebacteria bacterium]|jgi:hypothetical protein|nr:hypothetical protein [Candidatus Paceibacterota bacterium]